MELLQISAELLDQHQEVLDIPSGSNTSPQILQQIASKLQHILEYTWSNCQSTRYSVYIGLFITYLPLGLT